MSDNGQIHEVTELAALYLSGAMSAAEREAFEARIAAGDHELIGKVNRLQSAAEALGEAISPVEPPRSIRPALLSRIESSQSRQTPPAKQSEPPAAREPASSKQVWRGWSATEDQALFTLRADQGQWEETGVAGVQVRRLFVDRVGNRMTAMF